MSEDNKPVENAGEEVKASTENETPNIEGVKIIKEEDTKETEKVGNADSKTLGKEAAEIESVDDILETEAEIETPHDDFDWASGNQSASDYDETEQTRLEGQYDKTLNTLNEFEIIKGKVSEISKFGDVLLDLGYKADGLLSLSEFRDRDGLAVGDEVEVYLEQLEDDRGQLVLSRRKAKLLRAWDSLVDSYDNGTIVQGLIVSKTKGGLIADVSGLETFLPGSQIDIKPIIDYDAYVGKSMELKVVKINEVIKNAVVSHKALIESDLAEQRETIIKELEKGQVLEGTVKNITDFGAFMDLGGVDGLLYITDISWGRINHPSEVLELNQKINVVVLDFDEEKKRISLGLKQLQPHPWDILDAEVQVGSIVKGDIVNIEDYGAFLEIIPGVEGLVHVSEVSWSTKPVNAREFFQLGTGFEAMVMTIDREERKMSLSIKQLTKDPWSEVNAKYKVGTTHSGAVKNLTPYGVFVELEEGIGGMIHVSDLSWTKRYSHPSEFTNVGSQIDVMILEIEPEDRRLSLGVKQLEENPWDTFENVFPVGSYHESTVVRKEERGAVVQLPYGLEAFSPLKHIRKEDKSYADVDETITVKVIEFNREDKRIIVSHLRYLQDIKKEAEDEVKKDTDKKTKQTKRQINKQASKVEMTTLGELEMFSQLKEQLAAGQTEAPAPKAKAEKKAEPKVEEKVAEVKEEVAEVKEEVAEVKAEVKEEKPKKAAKATKADKPDDLKKIEGVGPKISELLANAGLPTFKDVAAAEVDKLKEILAEAGSRYRMHDPTTWPKQAALAAEGKWDELKAWQDELDGGK